ncbi:MAG: nicotinate-nucleotide diphosphorylase (carboxylating) [Candidatus Sungbacteria bacterium RIFCSPLOWO2_12_FULL_41_11]|uniref:nicotinate-nucleotide diphosphorylase (carboxylating) n=1 Tax=Candidatus Sungbacteria bacterium RIFCSPLOWO2_12_FULL_41_11 TaxID=1802286 RepID=A0A1G2LM14_9BACT|nr:MAG: nicotinate-nucleotide pyrophosphorylase [Parcubacteria group bacterium GW2011_GWA2_42_14]OHA12680.1 MAG: nicotinate-nucleotide diphosphorylase (carboxylating) [Candidatus Sungbacteria bacterium RIFCSPLOWO2_12_FULL_41_11]
MNEIYIRRKLEEFLSEDLGSLEVNPGPNPEYVTVRIVVQDVGIFCGGRLIKPAFDLLAQYDVHLLDMVQLLDDGTLFSSGDVLAEFRVEKEILRNGIRIVLNLLGHLSGIATNTRMKVNEVSGTNCKLLDTRKTLPGLRAFEKYAVKVGGAHNHRPGRYAGILIKKEDIKIYGGIKKAIDKASEEKSHLVEIEVEVENSEQLEEVVRDGRIRYILLDNMSIDEMKKAVHRAGCLVTLEASGIGGEDLKEVAETGVHYISLSSLILGARPIKMHMIIVEAGKRG